MILDMVFYISYFFHSLIFSPSEMIRIKQLPRDLDNIYITTAMKPYGTVLRILKKTDEPDRPTSDAYVVYNPIDSPYSLPRMKKIVCCFSILYLYYLIFFLNRLSMAFSMR